jgi:hypothetical protein
MLNEVRRKPEKPRIRKMTGGRYECTGAGISSWGLDPNTAFLNWKVRYEPKTKTNRRS